LLVAQSGPDPFKIYHFVYYVIIVDGAKPYSSSPSLRVNWCLFHQGGSSLDLSI
jgi:hypothetical protein